MKDSSQNHALLGMRRFPNDDTILNYFRRFNQGEIERFWRPLWGWLIDRVPWLASGYSLDLDSTIFARHGSQQQEPLEVTILGDLAD